MYYMAAGGPMNAMRCAVIALSLCTIPAAAQDSNTFTSATAGFSLKKPTSWTFESLGRTTADVNAEDLQRLHDGPGKLVLVQLSKEGRLDSFGVTLLGRPPRIAHASPKQVLEHLVLPGLQKGRPGFTLESLRQVELSGHEAAEYVATDTIRSEAGSMRIRLRAILVARGEFFFLIDMMAPVESYERSSEEFAAILSSITIAK